MRRRLRGAGSGACGGRTTVRTPREASAGPPTGTMAGCHGLALRAGRRAVDRSKDRKAAARSDPGTASRSGARKPGTEIAAAGAGTVPEKTK